MMGMNLIMCDKNCKHQSDGYCQADGCKPTAKNSECLYFEERETPKMSITVECHYPKAVPEIGFTRSDSYQSEGIPNGRNAE